MTASSAAIPSASRPEVVDQREAKEIPLCPIKLSARALLRGARRLFPEAGQYRGQIVRRFLGQEMQSRSASAGALFGIVSRTTDAKGDQDANDAKDYDTDGRGQSRHKGRFVAEAP
jgi:hypothetical protein